MSKDKVAKIEKRTLKLSDMEPHPRNPRVSLQPGMPKYEALKKSILSFDYIDPIVWNERTGRIVGGHQRYTVLKNEGFTHADVSVVNMNEAKELAALIALNKVEGEWDYEILPEVLASLEESYKDTVGFTQVEYDNLMTALPEFDPVEAWKDMPEFVSENKLTNRIIVNFESDDDRMEFGRIIGQKITRQTKSIWFPAKEDVDHTQEFYMAEEEE